jgi:hypothetical protein
MGAQPNGYLRTFGGVSQEFARGVHCGDLFRDVTTIAFRA